MDAGGSASSGATQLDLDRPWPGSTQLDLEERLGQSKMGFKIPSRPHHIFPSEKIKPDQTLSGQKWDNGNLFK